MSVNNAQGVGGSVYNTIAYKKNVGGGQVIGGDNLAPVRVDYINTDGPSVMEPVSSKPSGRTSSPSISPGRSQDLPDLTDEVCVDFEAQITPLID